MESGQTRMKPVQKQTARDGRHASSLPLRTGVRAGANDDSCLPCGNCMYDCAVQNKENCVKKCAAKCGYPS